MIPGVPGMSGAPSFDIQGGDAAPSHSDSGDQYVNPWMSSPFSVGSGASSSSGTPAPGVTPYSVIPGAVNAGNLVPVLLAGGAVLALVVFLKKR